MAERFVERRTRQWINPQGEFIFGKHKGDLVEDVADEDPDYLRWILDKVDDIDEGDAEIIGEHLARKGGR